LVVGLAAIPSGDSSLSAEYSLARYIRGSERIASKIIVSLTAKAARCFGQQRTAIGRARARPDRRSLARQTFRLRFGPGSRSNALTRTSAVRSAMSRDVALRWALLILTLSARSPSLAKS